MVSDYVTFTGATADVAAAFVAADVGIGAGVEVVLTVVVVVVGAFGLASVTVAD